MKTNKNKRNLFNRFKATSIEAQIVQKFILIVAVLLFVMWILEIIFFSLFYENVKVGDLQSNFNEVKLICGRDNYQEELNDLAFRKNINIIIATKNDDNFEPTYTSFNAKEEKEYINKLNFSYEKLDKNDYTTYQIPADNYKIVVYFSSYQNSKSETNYIYIESILTPLTSTSEVFARLLIMVSMVGFIVAAFISYFLSKNIANPINMLSREAKKLSEGNLDIEFKNEEYLEVKELSHTLNYAIKEIKKSQKLQKEVISNITHELKTPLTMIYSYAELINDISGDNKEKREEHLKIIMEETEKLKYLVDDIMQYSKLESGLIEYEKTTFDIVLVLKKYEEFYRTNFGNKGYSFEFNLPEEELLIDADKKRIEQVIVNLINNAINYSTENKLIKITLTKFDEELRLTVRDYGIGIEEKDLEHIFEKHFRSVGAKRVSVGSGIGLSICKSILEFHEFNYGVKSEINKGSVFYVDFPLSKNKNTNV